MIYVEDDWDDDWDTSPREVKTASSARSAQKSNCFGPEMNPRHR